MSHKKIICVDFDGVLCQWVPWSGPRTIKGYPVDGALQWLCERVQDPGIEVHIYSSRSKHWGGRRAMKRWLKKHYAKLVPTAPGWFRQWIAKTDFADPWEDELDWAIRRIIGQIKFPVKKPPAYLTIDDRVWRFDGTFPTADEIQHFKPWYRR